MRATDTFDVRAAVRTTCIALAVAIALWLLGRGALSTPPVESWTQFQRWLASALTRGRHRRASRDFNGGRVLSRCSNRMTIARTSHQSITSIASCDHSCPIGATTDRPRVGAGVATAAVSVTCRATPGPLESPPSHSKPRPTRRDDVLRHRVGTTDIDRPDARADHCSSDNITPLPVVTPAICPPPRPPPRHTRGRLSR